MIEPHSTIWITRPLPAGERLAQALSAQGWQAKLLPTLSIQPSADPKAIEKALDDLKSVNAVIFVSCNAVEGVRVHLNDKRLKALQRCQCFAVGQATAQAVEALGIPHCKYPEVADSEHLLDLAPLQSVAQQSIVIFRGQSGRELLAETLIQRGAHVNYVECYRSLARVPSHEYLQSIQTTDVVVITSVKAMEALMQAPQSHDRVVNACWLVVSERIASIARERYQPREVVVAEGASDQMIISVLAQRQTNR